MAVASCVAATAGSPIQGTTCGPSSMSNSASTDPSLNTNCTSSTPTTLASSPPGPMNAGAKIAPMVNQFTAPIQKYRQNNPPVGFSVGGPVYLAAGGTGCAATPQAATPAATPQYDTRSGSGPYTNVCTGTCTPANYTYTPVANPTCGQTYYTPNLNGCGYSQITYNSGTKTDSAPKQIVSCAPGSTPSCAYATSGVPGTTPTQNSQIQNTMTQNASGNATLPAGTQINPTLIQNSSCQQLNPNAYNVSSQGLGVTPATGGQAQEAPPPTPITAAGYNPAQVTCTPKMTAAQANACPNAILSNQIQDLTGPLANNQIPEWAQPSVNYVNQIMAGRGIGSSTLAGQGLFNAIQAAALPIAQGNASYFATLQQANLTNEQQAAVQNQNAQVQTLLSNQSAVNAALQFNATSENQTNQFMSNLGSQVALSNAAQANAMSQFNAGQINSVGEFNSNLQNQINQFNAQNQLAVDQSNVTWRRNINTQNTAAQNAATQVNAQNLFNLTTTAQNNLWQQLQDQASWANTDAQNSLTRDQNMAIASLGTQTAFSLQSSAGQQQFLQYLGQFGLDVFNAATTPTSSGS